MDITGKHGVRITSLKRNKAVTVSGANGMVSGGLMEAQTGSKFKSGTTSVLWWDYLTVSLDSTTPVAYTTYTAQSDTAGAEIVSLYVKNSDGTADTELAQDAAVAAGKFTYDKANKLLTFYNDIENGTEIAVCYYRTINAVSLANLSDTYSSKCAMYIDAIGEDKCANEYRVQFYIPKADFNGNFDFEMGENQTVHNFEAEALAGACGAAGQFWTYTIFGAKAADAA